MFFNTQYVTFAERRVDIHKLRRNKTAIRLGFVFFRTAIFSKTEMCAKEQLRFEKKCNGFMTNSLVWTSALQRGSVKKVIFRIAHSCFIVHLDVTNKAL